MAHSLDKCPMNPKHPVIIEHSVPDYPLEAQLSLEPDQIRVLFEETRLVIADLLGERAASVTQLAAALRRPKGTVAHHVARMEEAGLVQVVRTRKVRAIEERFYGRTARTFLLHQLPETEVPTDVFLRQAMAELRPEKPALVSLRYARIPQEQAATWAHRLEKLLDEFVGQPRDGEQSYGLLVAIYPTDRPTLEDGKE